ncbi:MAG: hypothetical protein EPO36_09770 [Chloroflexota bacterium]|nr:MAG: hypothetical protein EPO36_09770 [Chloroflexota bacterium]
MPRLTIAAAAIVAVVAIGSAGIVLGSASLGGCPTAQVQGMLVNIDGTLRVQAVPSRQVMPVAWPIGYGVRDDQGVLVLTRFLVVDIAREGDTVSVGGGMSADDSTFQGCGPVRNGL